MAFNKNATSVWAVGIIYIAVGLLGFDAHFQELLSGHRDAVGMEVTELAALIAGVGLLLRQKWARWLALAWILLHVGISALHPGRDLALHLLILIFVVWGLFRRKAREWFAGAKP